MVWKPDLIFVLNLHGKGRVEFSGYHRNILVVDTTDTWPRFIRKLLHWMWRQLTHPTGTCFHWRPLPRLCQNWHRKSHNRCQIWNVHNHDGHWLRK